MTATAGDDSTGDAARVDPRAPRFGQALTASLLLVGVAAQRPVFVYLVAVALGIAAATRWRVDPWGLLWRALRPVVGRPETAEAAAPHRFAKLMGVAGTALASALLLGGYPVAAYGVAALVATAAGLAAATGLCIGCRLYQHVGLARRLGVV